MIAQVKNTSVKWSIKPRIVRTKKTSKALRKETVDWTMKNSNLRQSPITCDTLLVADADTKVKRRVPKLVLECSMQQLHNELIASPDDGGLVGARHTITNDVIISDTMIFICLRLYAFKDSCIYYEVLHMAQPHIIFDYLSLDVVEEALKNEALCH